jgi:hypothetical protein
MPDALIIHGNAQRYMIDAGSLRKCLETFGVPTTRTRVVNGMSVAESIVEYRLESAICQRTKNPLLIAYIGHGNSEGWWLDDVRSIKYAKLAELLTLGQRPVVVMNDTCDAYAAVVGFNELRVSEQRVSLLAACGVNQMTYGGFTRAVNQSIVHGTPIDFPGYIRWGAKIDSVFRPS